MNDFDLNTYSKVIDSPNIVCECGCRTFTQASVLKKVSSLITMTGKEEILDIPIYVCSKCGKIPNEYLEKANAKRILGLADDETKEEKKSTLIL